MHPAKKALNWYENKVRDTKWARADKPYYPCPVTGQLSSSEAHWLFTKNLGPGNYAHLGVLRGLSAWCQLWGLKDTPSKVFCVDLWEQNDEFLTWSTAPDLEAFIKVCLSEGFYDKTVICKGFTSEWAEKLKDHKFQFVFIDAGHTYEAAKEDWLLWSALVVPGGEVAFHDAHDIKVESVILEIDLDLWEETEGVFTIRSFRKK